MRYNVDRYLRAVVGFAGCLVTFSSGIATAGDATLPEEDLSRPLSVADDRLDGWAAPVSYQLADEDADAPDGVVPGSTGRVLPVSTSANAPCPTCEKQPPSRRTRVPCPTRGSSTPTTSAT